MLLDEFYRETWADIHLDRLQYNIQQYRRLFPVPHVMAVVKANAYGHGDVKVAEAALQAGATMLAVATLDEAVRLRQAEITAPIFVLGATHPRFADVAARQQISLTVFQAQWLAEAKQYLTQPVAIHLKFDTGMGRLGMRTEGEVAAVLAELDERFVVDGVYSHFATADELELTYFAKQLARFNEMIQWLPFEPTYIHCANSATALRFAEARFNTVRLGISMYGLTPSTDIASQLPFPLQPVFELYSTLVHVKQLEAGESISYGATYTTAEAEWIGTIPIGYADGWIRKMSGFSVIVNGERCPIVGRVCMDQCMVRLPYEMPIGTKVTLIGVDGSERNSMEDVAKHVSTINYEIPCLITARVPRMYKKNNKNFFVRNDLLMSNMMGAKNTK